MEAQLHIRKSSAPDSQIKTVPVNRFPCVMASDPQTPHLQVRLPPSFPGALMLVQQVDKLLLRTGPQTPVQINENLAVRADDWAQLRPGDCLTCGAWFLQIEFALAPHFPAQYQSQSHAPQNPTQVVVESENEPVEATATPVSDSLPTTVSLHAIHPQEPEVEETPESAPSHPIFGDGDDMLDLDDMMEADPLLTSVEPELTEELSRLALPSPPLSPEKKEQKPKPASKKKNTTTKTRRRSQSAPRDTGRVYLHLRYPGSPNQDTGKRPNEEEYLPLPTGFQLPRVTESDESPASPSESENNAKQANQPTTRVVTKKKPTTPQRKTKKAKATPPASPKKRGRPAQSVLPTAAPRAAPATPSKRKGRPPAPKAQADKPRRATIMTGTSPGRALPSRASRGRMLSEEEKSRLSRESNAELRRLIGEKKH